VDDRTGCCASRETQKNTREKRSRSPKRIPDSSSQTEQSVGVKAKCIVSSKHEQRDKSDEQEKMEKTSWLVRRTKTTEKR
jgi:hypothetical protein